MSDDKENIKHNLTVAQYIPQKLVVLLTAAAVVFIAVTTFVIVELLLSSVVCVPLLIAGRVNETLGTMLPYMTDASLSGCLVSISLTPASVLISILTSFLATIIPAQILIEVIKGKPLRAAL